MSSYKASHPGLKKPAIDSSKITGTIDRLRDLTLRHERGQLSPDESSQLAQVLGQNPSSEIFASPAWMDVVTASENYNKEASITMDLVDHAVGDASGGSSGVGLGTLDRILQVRHDRMHAASNQIFEAIDRAPGGPQLKFTLIDRGGVFSNTTVYSPKRIAHALGVKEPE